MELSDSDLALIKAMGRKKKAVRQSLASGAFNALLRCSVRESATPVSVTEPMPLTNPATDFEGPRIKVVLITEGLGNRRDMNYYGPEAIDSAPAIFEGAHCYLNHPSVSEERDIPERRVQDMCGYFKNVMVETVQGRRAVTGELHFDLSDSGRMGFTKTQTALHYQTEFPGSDREYVGLSVNADGSSEPRKITLEGQPVDVNYVTQFTEAMSCDIVTLPARGGKILALVESAAGAELKNKEVRKMLVKELQAAQSDLKESASIKDPEKKAAKVAEAQKKIEALLKAALDAANRKKESEGGSETESETAEAEGEGEGEAIPEPGHKVKKTVSTTVHHVAPEGDEDKDKDKEESEKNCNQSEAETAEANRLAVKHLIAESGLEPELFDVAELASKGVKEAKREIARTKRVAEAWTKRALKAVGDVSPAHAAKFAESGKSGEKSDTTDLFAGCSR